MTKAGITNKAYQEAADDLGCDVAAVKAVAEVESAGAGFLASGRVKILLEGHVFHKLTKGKYDSSHPTISYPKWTKQFYIGGEGEYRRFNEAFALDPNAAMKACSWGKFQIMGYNFSACGFDSVAEYVDAMKESEDEHLEAFIDYCKSDGLAKYLKSHSWAAFAKAYNGPGYQRNEYDKRLQAAYKKHLKDPAAEFDPAVEHAVVMVADEPSQAPAEAKPTQGADIPQDAASTGADQPESPAPSVATIPAVAPMPAKVPGILSKIGAWVSGLSLTSIVGSLTVFKDHPEILPVVVVCSVTLFFI
jgi:hypothetical protein